MHGTKTSSTSAPSRKRMITAVLPCHNPTALSSRKNQLIALEELPLRLRTSPCRAQPCPPASGPALNAVLLNFWCGTKNYWRLVELFPARPLGRWRNMSDGSAMRGGEDEARLQDLRGIGRHDWLSDALTGSGPSYANVLFPDHELAAGALWLHEIKHDRFRVIARKDGARVKL